MSPRVRVRHFAKAAVAAAVVAGAVCVSGAGWIHAKATLAQVLIAAAWRREQLGLQGAQPWPWADTHPLAELTFGEGNAARRFMILEGSSGRNLAFGPAHDPASVAPGDSGNSVIEGHRDTHFAILENIKLGASLHVYTAAGSRVDFAVTDIRVVDSRRSRISLHADIPTLTLVTCYPFNAFVPGGPLRFIVTAERSLP